MHTVVADFSRLWIGYDLLPQASDTDFIATVDCGKEGPEISPNWDPAQ